MRLLVFLFLLSGLFRQLPAQNSLQAALNALKSDPDMGPASWSFTALDMASGTLVASHDPDRSLPTASTMKLVSTATALAVLGPEFRFQTRLEVDGEIRNGVLFGNVFITGDGDPSLGSSRLGSGKADELLLAWTDALKAKGIQAVKGAVIADASIFTSQMTPDGWNWEDMGNYYGAGASGLNFLENTYEIHLMAGAKAGDPVQVLRTEPYIPGLQVISELVTGAPGSGDNAYIFGAPYTGLRYVRGTIPPGNSLFTIKGSIPDPALFLAQRLDEELKKCGVRVEGVPGTVRELAARGAFFPAATRTIHTWTSPPLKELVTFTNQKSLNLYAEAFVKRIAVARKESGSTEAGIAVVASFWQQKGLSSKGITLKDGSGLSPGNGLTTRWMASMLRTSAGEPWYPAFYASLPVAGRSGTLENMLRGTAAEGNLRAKSGFIEGVRAYAGYVTTRSGKQLAFSFIAHRYDCSPGAMRQKMEKVMAAMAAMP